MPLKIKDKLKKLKNILTNDFNIDNYIKLHYYLYKLNNTSWKLSEFIKGEKNINGINMQLYDTEFNSVYIELIYDNYKITNYITFINDNINNDIRKIKNNYYSADFDDLIKNKKIFYYIVLKKYQVFLHLCTFKTPTF